MAGPFIGSEAIAAGVLTKGQLATCRVRLYREVYVTKDIDITAVDRAKAAWLWSRRRGVVAGFSASALHGSKWVEATRPAELIHDNRHRLSGLRVRTNSFEPDEVQAIAGVPVTIPARTALDWLATARSKARKPSARSTSSRPAVLLAICSPAERKDSTNSLQAATSPRPCSPLVIGGSVVIAPPDGLWILVNLVAPSAPGERHRSRW
jgi:hypothetical protein